MRHWHDARPNGKAAAATNRRLHPHRPVLVTLKVTFHSLICSVLLGVAIAFAFVQSKWIESAFFPYAVLLQVTPIVAIAPLIIIWVKSPTASLVICALGDPNSVAHSERAAVFFWWTANLIGPSADWCSRRRICRGYGRHRHWARVSNFAERISAKHPAYVCCVDADHCDWRGAVCTDGGAFELGAGQLARKRVNAE